MRMSRWLLLPLLLALAVGLGYAVLSLPDHANGLQKMVANKMEVSGVSNPVTAVLLNFRGYDTLLEMGIVRLNRTHPRKSRHSQILTSIKPAPLGKSGMAVLLEIASTVKMAFSIKVIINR